MYLIYTQENQHQLFEGIVQSQLSAEKYAKSCVDEATRNSVYVVDLLRGFELGHAWFGGDGEIYYHKNKTETKLSITQELKDVLHSFWLMIP